MASPAEIMQPLPETLPEDFSEWDGGSPPATQPVNSGVAEAAPEIRAVPERPSHPGSPRYTVVSVLDGATDLPAFTARTFYAADQSLFQSFRTHEANKVIPEPASKKRIVVPVVAVASILLLLAVIARAYPGLLPRLSVVKQSFANMSTSASKDLASNAPKPSPSKLLTGAAQPTTIATKPLPSTDPATSAEPATDTTADPALPQVQSKMMTDQLTAPQQIPHELKTVAQKEAPPSAGFAGTGMEGLESSSSNVTGSVFGGNNGSKVKVVPAPKVNISSGVAAGMLVHATVPQYPEIAKLARVSGTVVLQATISKVGSIENLRAVSGPSMLRQSALDAVKSWRYRPYMLNGEPVETETSINVVFTTPGQ